MSQAGLNSCSRKGLGIRNAIKRLPEAGLGLWPDHRANPVPPSGPSVAPANLRLAGLRPVSGLSRAEWLFEVLGKEDRGRAAFGDGRSFAADQASRNQAGRRRLPAALNAT